jgi:hypothetical protein
MATARTNAPPPPPPPPPSGAALATPRGQRRHELVARLREAASGTPGTMRLLGVGAVVVLVAFGVLGAFTLDQRDDAIADAQAEAAQLVRLQTVRTNLVEADALATNAFLLAGLEPSAQRDRYESSLATATATLADVAANSRPNDSEALRGVNQSIARYAGLVESARANNRQGFPVGAAYQRQASGQLRTDVLPVLTDLSDVTQSRVKNAYRDIRSSSEWLATGALIAIVLLVIVQGYLTVRTRRLFSLPVLLAGAIVIVATLVAGAVLVWTQSQADDVRDGDYRTTVGLAQARIFAFDAKSYESLTLILRGSGQEAEQRFQSLSDAARSTMRDNGVSSDVVGAFSDYLRVHDEVRTQDDQGDWVVAVDLATRANGGSNEAFQRFADVSNEQLTRTASNISDDLDDARLPLGPTAVVLVIAGIAAAIAAWQGVAARLKEYR